MRILTSFALGFVLACAAVWAQAISTSQISGPNGGWVLTNLPVGPYRLEVAKEGFSKYLESGIVLKGGQQSE
jgi:hypothetical protein